MEGHEDNLEENDTSNNTDTSTSAEENNQIYGNSLCKEGRKPCVKFVRMNTLIMKQTVICETTWSMLTLQSCIRQRINLEYLSKAKCPEGHAKRITDHITDMVVRDLRPAVMIEEIVFQALINYVEPGYRVPSATHIAKVARRKFANGKAAIKDYLYTGVEFFAFTMDIWTS